MSLTILIQDVRSGMLGVNIVADDVGDCLYQVALNVDGHESNSAPAVVMAVYEVGNTSSFKVRSAMQGNETLLELVGTGNPNEWQVSISKGVTLNNQSWSNGETISLTSDYMGNLYVSVAVSDMP